MNVQTIAVPPGLPIEELVKELIDSAADRIIFKSGPETTVLNHDINLRLLKFYAEEEDMEVWIQTANPHLKMMAEHLAIPVILEQGGGLRRTDPAQSDEISAPEMGMVEKTAVETAAAPDDEKQSAAKVDSIWQQGGILIAAASAFFALVIAVWWFLQPAAVVTVYPKEKDLSLRAHAQVDPGYTDRQLKDGKIPGKVLVKEASLTVHTQTTGRKTMGVIAATGVITFINNSTQAIIVPRGSIVIGRENCRFATVQDVLVPKKAAKKFLGIVVGEEYGRVEAGITALQKGESGNQPAKAIGAIEGPLQRSLKVVNLTPTMKGLDKQVAVVAPEDLKRSSVEAQRQMVLAAPDYLAGLAGKDYFFWPELAQTNIIRNLYQPEIGMEGATLTNRIDYRASALVVSRIELNKFLSGVLDDQTPPNFRPVNHSLAPAASRLVRQGEFAATLEIEAKARIRGVLDPQKLQRLLAGKTLDAAKDALNAADEIADFQIDLRRSTVRLPKFAFQIKVLLPEGIAPR